METRRTIIVIVLAVLLMFLWSPLITWVGTQLGYDMTAPQRQIADGPTTQPSTTQPALPPTIPAIVSATQPNDVPGMTVPTPAAPTTADVPSMQQGVRLVGGAAQAVSLGSDQPFDETWAIKVDFSTRGASVQRVTLNDHRREVRSDERYVMAEPYPGQPGTATLATQKVRINTAEIDLSSADWRIASTSDRQVVFELDVFNADVPVVTLRKAYTIEPRAEGGEDGPRGLQVRLEQTVINRTGAALQFDQTFNGPTLPPAELDYGIDRQIIGGYFDGSRITASGYSIESLSEKYPTYDPLNYDGVPSIWFGTASTYFTSILRPIIAETQRATDVFEKVESRLLNPQERRSYNFAVATTINTKSVVLAPQMSSTLDTQVYFGPRKREILTNAYYGAPLVRMDRILVIAVGPCSFCVFDSLINGLVFLLRGFHFIVRDWGIAIIILVVLVRVLLHPITRKSQLSMMKMAKLGPEMERLKKKYGDNKEELSRAMMQFYRESGFNPVMGCLPMFLQMPIWIALWQALHTTFELRHAPFLYGFTWINDLARPDHLIDFGRENSFNLLFLHISGINVLPILLAVVFYIQMKLQPKPAAMTPEQQMQQKMMLWMMPILFPLILYPQPSGLNLYILVSTVIGIVESKRVRAQYERMEALEKAGAVVVDAPEQSGRKKIPSKTVEPEKPKTGLAGWLQRMQEKAEEVRREASRQQGKKKK